MATSRTTERPALPTSSEPAAARHLNGLCKYVVEKRLQKSLEKTCVEVMKGAKVPRNPYPVFVQRARQQAERIRLSSWTIPEGFQSSTTFPTEPTALGHVAGSKGFSHVWGHPVVLRCVSPPAIERAAWLIEDVTPPLSILRCGQPYTIQVLPALTGPSIFSDTLFPAPHELAILQLYVIAGPDPERASALYADCVLGDVLRTVQQGRHYLLRVKVPSSSEGHFDLFNKEEVEARRSAFLSGVQRSLKTQLPVQADCVWRTDPQGAAFQGGVKLYSLCVLQTSETLRGEKVLDFSECPLIHLYSSVFLHQAHAEAYVRMFLPAKGHPGPTGKWRSPPCKA
ncbi:uncharacterized protein LOC114667617 [Erpetoichthys calabaricus]|uniref:uncharacterized protein LOC114667617 n=1 Tax=Erpetoichthys calabaricus TaxID=27687 RepID=UPI002233ED11|nr:uncharacterized protein LOC114667617 [Erpetoichthys calabaricus]